MSSSMIVVANSTSSRIFTMESAKSPLREVETLVNPAGRMHEKDMVSDLPGKNPGVGGNKHAFHEKIEPKQHEMSSFAKRVAEYLDDARKSKKLGKLLLVAEPSFLGELRSKLSDELLDKIIFESDKNITTHSIDDIRSHLPKHF